MSEDEVLVLVFSSLVAAGFWLRWYYVTLAVARGAYDSRSRSPLLLAPAICGVALFAVLRTCAAHDVRDAPEYLFMYMVLGAAWLGIAAYLLSLTGISARDDAIERRNPAAAWAVAGGLLGITFCFAGANIGDGPGWWVVVYCASLSTGGLVVLWVGLGLFAGTAELVTVERDVASGLRLGGFLVAEGLILGRAVAGDWQSVAAANVDFVRQVWPALLLWPCAAVLDRVCRPTTDCPQRSVVACGLCPLVVFVGVAAFWLWISGLPE